MVQQTSTTTEAKEGSTTSGAAALSGQGGTTDIATLSIKAAADAAVEAKAKADADALAAKEADSIVIFDTVYSITFILYTILYFASIGGFLAAMMVTNIIKMFKLDEDIRTLTNEALNWFMTPPSAEEKERMDKSQSLHESVYIELAKSK